MEGSRRSDTRTSSVPRPLRRWSRGDLRVAERFVELYRDRTMVVGFAAFVAVVMLVGIDLGWSAATGSLVLGAQDLVALGYSLAAGGLGTWAWRLRRRGPRRPLASLCLATALLAVSLAVVVLLIGQETSVAMPEVYFIIAVLASAGFLPLPPVRFLAVTIPSVAGAIGTLLFVRPAATPLLSTAIVGFAALIAVAMAHFNFTRMRSMYASQLRAEDAFAEREEFLRILAHDLRNPIGALPDFAALIRHKHDANPSVDMTTELDVLESTARGVRAQLDNVLLWGRAREGRLQVEDGVVDVPDLIRSIFESVAAHAHLKQIGLVTDTPVVLPVRSDPGLLHAIIRNLVDNALKFTEAGGQVRVACRLEGAVAVIVVEDDGIGMASDDDQPQRSGTGGEHGSGLGLSLARTLAARLGASITIDSKPDAGTVVRVAIPSRSRRHRAGRTRRPPTRRKRVQREAPLRSRFRRTARTRHARRTRAWDVGAAVRPARRSEV